MMVVGEQSPRDVFPLLSLQMEASVTQVATGGAPLGYGQPVPRACPGRKDQLCTIPKGDIAENLSAPIALPVALPDVSAKTEPSCGVCHLARSIFPQKPRAEPSQSTRRPSSRDGRPRGRRPQEGEFLMHCCSAGKFLPVPPPCFLGEVGPSHPNDVDFARSEKRYFVGLREELGAISNDLVEFFERFPALLDGCERPSLAGAANRPETTAFCVVRHPSRGREIFQLLVPLERRVTDQAMCVQTSLRFRAAEKSARVSCYPQRPLSVTDASGEFSDRCELRDGRSHGAISACGNGFRGLFLAGG
jgi:hypothetical protein